MNVITALGQAIWMAFVMLWDIFWGLSLGFLFSAIIEEIVSKDEMSRLLPDCGPRSVLIAGGLGAASSSCSYAAVAVARSMVRKGADFTAAMAFQFAATNLVLELGVLLIVLLGWQFGVAEFIGGPIMIVLLVLTFRLSLSTEKKRRPWIKRAGTCRDRWKAMQKCQWQNARVGGAIGSCREKAGLRSVMAL